MTARSYRLLRSVQVASPAGLSLGQLADVLQCDAARATRQVDELQDRGLVRRCADGSDRRRRVVRTTETADWLLEEAESLRANYLRQVLAHWAPSEVTDLCELLERFNRDVGRHPLLRNAPART